MTPTSPRVIRDHIPEPSEKGQKGIQQALAIVRAYTPKAPTPQQPAPKADVHGETVGQCVLVKP